MKKIVFINIVFIMHFTGAQYLFSQNYHPLLNDSATWYYAFNSGWGAITDPTHIKGEEIINEMVYKSYGYVEMGNVLAYVREDTIERKVYIMMCSHYNEGKEVLLYDFSMEVGDSICYEYFSTCINIIDIGCFHVDSIIPFTTENGNLKAYYLSGSQPWDKNIIWIEGIGSLGLFEEPFNSSDTSGGNYSLNCYYQGDQLFYQSTISKRKGECNINDYNKIENSTSNKLIIYPNPSESTINIEGLIKDSRITVYDIYGRQMFSAKSFVPGIIRINIRDWEKGTYFISIHSTKPNSHEYFNEIFIKN